MPTSFQTVDFPLAENGFDEIIDVRAPVEFAEDHMTGAINLPVLRDEERELVGTQFKQDSAFAAQKSGAAMVSTNIGRHMQEHFAAKPESYRPLIYCFRGGQRSRSLATVLSEIGWEVSVIEGGYKSYRRHVLRTLEELSRSLSFRVIDGLTGSGKTLLLHALETHGAQVLDLEGFANHKGSVFGANLADSEQPAQKRFESLIYDRLSLLSDSAPIFVEAESARIGRLFVPLPLLEKIRKSPVAKIEAPLDARVNYLHRDYMDWLASPETVIESIDRLRSYHSKETIARWKQWCGEGNWKSLISELLSKHYDQYYGSDGQGNYRDPDTLIELDDLSEEAIQHSAVGLLRGH